MQKPPTKRQVSSIRFKVVPKNMFESFVVFQADRRCALRIGKRHDAGKIAKPTEEVELDARKEGQEGERVNESKRPCQSCNC